MTSRATSPSTIVPSQADIERITLRALADEGAANQLATILENLPKIACLAICARAMERTLPVIFAPSGICHHDGVLELNRAAHTGLETIGEVLRRCDGREGKTDLPEAIPQWSLPGLTHQFNHALGTLLMIERWDYRPMSATALWSSILAIGWTGLDVGLHQAVAAIQDETQLDDDSTLQIRNTVRALKQSSSMVAGDIVRAAAIGSTWSELSPGERLSHLGPLWDAEIELDWLRTFFEVQGSRPLGLGFTDVVEPKTALERLDQGLTAGPFDSRTAALCREALTPDLNKRHRSWLRRLLG